MDSSRFKIQNTMEAWGCEEEEEELLAALTDFGYDIFEAEQPPGVIVPYHAHKREESIIILEGKMQFNVEEELSIIESGQVITINANAIHSAATIEDQSAKILIAFKNEIPKEELHEESEN